MTRHKIYAKYLATGRFHGLLGCDHALRTHFTDMALKRADPFYLSPTWRRLRQVILKRDGYRCVVCGADVSVSGAATVDHIKPRKTHPGLALEPSNLRTLCNSRRTGNGCDNQTHREKGSGSRGRDDRVVIRGADASGLPLDPDHFWNR